MAQDPPEPNPDDETILDDARLLRRVPRGWVYRLADGGSRPFSGSFKAKPGQLSVLAEPLLHERDLTYHNALDGLADRFLLVAVTAGQVRDLGLGIIRDPQADDGLRGEAHALVTGRLSDEARDVLASACEKLVWE